MKLVHLRCTNMGGGGKVQNIGGLGGRGVGGWGGGGGGQAGPNILLAVNSLEPLPPISAK